MPVTEILVISTLITATLGFGGGIFLMWFAAELSVPEKAPEREDFWDPDFDEELGDTRTKEVIDSGGRWVNETIAETREMMQFAMGKNQDEK